MAAQQHQRWRLPLAIVSLAVPVAVLLGVVPLVAMPVVWAPTFAILWVLRVRDRRRARSDVFAGPAAAP
jgi:hypothetical protein